MFRSRHLARRCVSACPHPSRCRSGVRVVGIHLSASTTRRIAVGPPSSKRRVVEDSPASAEFRRTYSTTTTTAAEKKGDDEAVYKNADLSLGELERRFGGKMTWSHEMLVKLGYSDLSIPIETFMRFLDYAQGGMSPDGGKPSYPLLTFQEIKWTDMPFKDWAPAPYNTLNHSCVERVMKVPMDPDGNAMMFFFARLHVLRKKMWHGMVPLTRERWLEKKMDDPKNYRMMMELGQDILNIFAWLNTPEALGSARDVYNTIVDAYVEFEGAANTLRERNGHAERLDMAGMWAEFYQANTLTMTERTHQWLVDRIEEIQARAFAEYKQTIEEKQGDTEAIAQASKFYYECVQDLNAVLTKADWVLAVPMTGFKGHNPSNSAFDLSIKLRSDTYGRLADTKDWTYLKKIIDAQERDGPEKPQDITDIVDEMKNGPKPAAPRFRDTDAFLGHYPEGMRNRAEVRKMFRGEPKVLGEEHWITILKERMAFYLKNGKDNETWNHNWGFVCYRLTYKQTDEEWSNFLKKFESDVFRSGEWIQGYDSIKDRAAIRYVDGRDVGIPEGDIEAAKKHFKKTYNMLPTLGRMWTDDFLVVDHESYDSHVKPQEEDRRPPPPYGPCFGDEGGFVNLVDTLEYPKDFIDRESPRYSGSMRVLSSLLLEEVYPLLADRVVRPTALWPLARLHPREVYVGHTVGSQESWWEFNRIQVASTMSRFMEHIRKKKEELDGRKTD